MVRQQRSTFKMLPFEFRVRLAANQEESVALVDLREMDGEWFDPALPRVPVRRYRRLHDVDLAVAEEDVAALPGAEHAVGYFVTLVPQELDGAE
jgi:hypothetical protein